jgi:hypothetical protein
MDGINVAIGKILMGKQFFFEELKIVTLDCLRLWFDTHLFYT